MAKLLALDWDVSEARIVVGRKQGDTLAVDHVVAVPLELDTQESNVEAVLALVQKGIASQRLPKCHALTAVGRSLIELRVLKLPPAPDEELPEMVRFQAMREFSNLRDDSPLDFVPLGDAAQEPGEVMAAAIPAELAKGIDSVLTGQGHESLRVIMRPCAATSLAMRRCVGARHGVTLVIAQQADSAELAVANHGTVVFTRACRLPSNWVPGESGEPLLGEVRRTIAAAQNQLSGARVQHIVLFGTPDEHGTLCEKLKERTSLDVELVEPFAKLAMSARIPKQPERFAALIGMLEDQVNDVRPVIDFVNPRKKPVAESNRRRNILYAATAATVALGIAGLIYWNYSQLEEEVSRLKFVLRQIEEENTRMKPTIELAKDLNQWKEADHNWLDELLHLSDNENLSAEDFRIETFTASSSLGAPGTIQLQGRAKGVEAKTRIQNELSDDDHDVLLLRDSAKGGDDRYPSTFTANVATKRYVPVVPAPKPAATEGARAESMSIDALPQSANPAVDDAVVTDDAVDEKDVTEQRDSEDEQVEDDLAN